jgi:glycosyltransferase involved in cell wall biosynthesis
VQTQITSWLRAINRGNGPLNILTVPTHERFETGLAKTGHNFFAITSQHTKTWDERYAPCPENYHVYDMKNGQTFPNHIEFDLALSQNKFGQFQLLANYANRFGIPMISLEHTLTVPTWGPEIRQQMVSMSGAVNVFISDYSIDVWGFDKNDPNVRVIRHAVDTELFKPLGLERNNSILTVANDFINRDWCLNFSQFCRVTNGLPVKIVGDTPGLSKPAASTEELVTDYNKSRVYLNTAHISPIPTSLLEAMACGCACVSIKSAAIPEYIQTGKNGLLVENDKDMRAALEFLLANAKEAERLGKAARQTILEKCTLDRFTSEWNSLFNEVILK